MPELPEWLGFIWRCFSRLQHDRPWTPRMEGVPVPGKIAWRDVVAWADRNGLDPWHAELLDHGIQALDAAYLEWWQADQRRQAENAGKGAGRVA